MMTDEAVRRTRLGAWGGGIGADILPCKSKRVVVGERMLLLRDAGSVRIQLRPRYTQMARVFPFYSLRRMDARLVMR